MRTFLAALVAFLPMAGIGTQLHEGGHFVAAHALGWRPTLHYGSVSYDLHMPREGTWVWTCPLVDGFATDPLEWGHSELSDAGRLWSSSIETDLHHALGIVGEDLRAAVLYVDPTGPPEWSAVRGVSLYEEEGSLGSVHHRVLTREPEGWRAHPGLDGYLPHAWVPGPYDAAIAGGVLAEPVDRVVVSPRSSFFERVREQPRPQLADRLRAQGRLPRVWGDAARIFVASWGPLTNLLIGTLGLLVLQRRRRGRWETPLGTFDWFALLAALFWSRQTFNLLAHGAGLALGLSGLVSDETRLDGLLGLPVGTLDAIGGTLGGIVCLYVVSLVPRPVPFVLGGGLGSLLGFGLWFGWIGPAVLP